MKNNVTLAVILAIILGFMIYEIGYWILDKTMKSDRLTEYKLYPYIDKNDPDRKMYQFSTKKPPVISLWE